jgi:hypothetical protein
MCNFSVRRSAASSRRPLERIRFADSDLRTTRASHLKCTVRPNTPVKKRRGIDMGEVDQSKNTNGDSVLDDTASTYPHTSNKEKPMKLPLICQKDNNLTIWC